MDQPAAALGRAAVEVTLENIQNPEVSEPKHIKMPTKLVFGETCLKKVDRSKR